MSRATKVSEFTILCHPFHNGAITGVDVCQRKPIVVTCGVDKVQTDVLNTYKWFPLNVTHLLIYFCIELITFYSNQTVRVWNYLSLEMELSKEFEENVSSVALHPTGLNILAGFTDKLRSVRRSLRGGVKIFQPYCFRYRLMNLLIDDIKTFREFPLRSSRVCRFSCGGHLLAAVSQKDIAVYSTINFKRVVSDAHSK